MAKLEDRLREVMRAKGWDHADVVRVSGQSSSVVSQWLGASSKEIKRIARVGAAVRLAEASGYSAEWIAEGTGPKHRAPARPASATAQAAAPHAAEPQGPYNTEPALAALERLLQGVPADHREAVASLLAGWAREGGATHWRTPLSALLASGGDSGKQAA